MTKTAEELAKEQKEISISEFFEKNKHLLGFDNPTKALLMSVKEAVDNSLDAAEEAGILPEIGVRIKNTKDDIFKVMVIDNGPGIVKDQIPRVFGKLLYGSKFHRIKQNRGQQGLGISCSVMYSQLTTGFSTKVWSKTNKKTHYYELHIDTVKNEPKIVKESDAEDIIKEHGTKIEMTMSGRYRRTVEDYLKQTSIANPFAKIVYSAPDGSRITFPRSTDKLPKPSKEMKPHPYGMEFGTLLRMLSGTKSKTVVAFLVNEFSSLGPGGAKEICKLAKIQTNAKPNLLGREQVTSLLNAMQKVKIQRPPMDCLSPIGEKELEKSLRKEYPNAEFITSVTREPEVYRGFPFIIEAAIVYGTEENFEIMRFANRVPLMYQAGACAITEAAKDIDWKRYHLQQNGDLPNAPIVLVVHMCSTWVPFISESKEAIASYPEIVKEVKLAIQDAARNLSKFLSGKRKVGEQKRRLQIFERYSGEVAEAVAKLTGKDSKAIEKNLKDFIEKRVQVDEDEGEVRET